MVRITLMGGHLWEDPYRGVPPYAFHRITPGRAQRFEVAHCADVCHSTPGGRVSHLVRSPCGHLCRGARQSRRCRWPPFRHSQQRNESDNGWCSDPKPDFSHPCPLAKCRGSNYPRCEWSPKNLHGVGYATPTPIRRAGLTNLRACV
jgi:hypothetical protein